MRFTNLNIYIVLKIIRPVKDTYICDKVVKGERVHNANTGLASSLNLFKLYGITSSGSSPNVELSRILMKFDLDPIRTLISSNKIDTNNGSFSCTLKLFDVNGGQTTPSNFTLNVNPLSRSFDEGLGRDIVLYGDNDVCNFLTASRSEGNWVLSGANSPGHNSEVVDYLTSMTLNGVSASLESSQLFLEGTENLSVDVTRIVSATLANQIPDEGFRIAFDSTLETDTRTYFVKRFASRHAYDDDYHPQLIFRFDDSLQDDTAQLYVGSNGSMFLYNFEQGIATNLLSGSSRITGSNSFILRMETPISGGTLTYSFIGSQHTTGMNPVTGIYSASIIIPESTVLQNKLNVSGSATFTPIWGSLDGTVGYFTGSSVRVYKPTRGSRANATYNVNVQNVKASYKNDEKSILTVNIFDPFSSNLLVSKVPIEHVGQILRDVHYSARCVETNKILIPFDTTYNSTRISSDSSGMFFELDFSNFLTNKTYVIDIMINTNGQERIFKNASAVFRITN